MSDEPFLNRWSRRKAEQKEPPAEAAPEPAPIPEKAPEPAPITEEELAALPPVETLKPGSDIRAFLRPGVPAVLKNAAMRKMWLLTPAIRDHKDCAVDYAWDWNTPGGVPGDGGVVDPAKAQEWARQFLTGERPPLKRGTPELKPEAEKQQAPAEAATPAAKPAAPKPAAAPAEHDEAEPVARLRHGGARPE